jgi:hypothetical protein
MNHIEKAKYLRFYETVPILAEPATFFMRACCLAYSSTLKMEATCSSERMVIFLLTARRCNPEDRSLYIRYVPLLGEDTHSNKFRPHIYFW